MCIDGLESMKRLWIVGKIKVTPFEFALLIQKIMIAIINWDN
jgi:hypothetical protein